jgi:benzoyl-CoA 2,3-dioxygenase component A
MNAPAKQHLIDPEICIRCHACEEACPIGAITHNDDNVVVDMDTCKHCMNCIGPCPTGAIDSWRVVDQPYSIAEQFEWMELPEQKEMAAVATGVSKLDEAVQNLLNEAHEGAGGATKAPVSAATPSINLYTINNPVTARVQGNFRLTADSSDSDVRHIIIDFADQAFPVLEGQSIGVIPPGLDAAGKPFLPRLYSISSPRNGERPDTNNFALTVKREKQGVCSNYVCDLGRDDEITLIGPFGSTFLMPDDVDANIIMICTGTGSAPFRAFTMQRQRATPAIQNKLTLFFGARTADSLPYFGPLGKVPETFLKKDFCLSQEPDTPKRYVQDGLIEKRDDLAPLLKQPTTHIYVCGLKAMEQGVEKAFAEICESAGMNWQQTRSAMRSDGRYHVETY